jgi:predicted nucleic acid-binding protein
MTIEDALQGIRRVGLDTSPFIYYIEVVPAYTKQVDRLFDLLATGECSATTSTVTLAEVLTLPIRIGKLAVAQQYREILQGSDNFDMLPVTADVAEQAAVLRAKYRIRTPDALQIATAIVSGCGAFITNDKDLKRVTEIPVLVLHELDA